MNADFNRNEDHMKLLLSHLSEKIEKIKAGGGKKNADRQRELGKLLARERIAELIDPGSRFFEFGTLAADGMYEEYGGCPAAGVITGIGYVSGRQCVIVANDATVKAGAWFPMAGKKNIRAHAISIVDRATVFCLGATAGGCLSIWA